MYMFVVIAFKIWMAVDCVQRGAERFWIWVIIFIPFGDWVYFFAVKAQDYRGHLAFGSSAPSLDELRRRYRTTPSQQNALELADALAAADEPRDAAEQYRAVLARDADSRQARLGLARALRDQGELDLAVREYACLLAADPKYADHAAALEHAELCWDVGERERALEQLASLAATSQRIDHQLAFAQHLTETGARERAGDVLDAALEAYEDSPDYVKRRDRVSAKEARRLLGTLRT